MKNILLLIAISFSSLLNAQNYVQDPTFDSNGYVVTNYNMYYDNNQGPKNVHFENNKYVLTQKTQLCRVNYDGTPDYSFGDAGFARIIIPNCPTCTAVIKDSKIINNNIFVFGKYNAEIVYGFVAKLSVNGIFDTTFGNNGLVTIPIGDIYYDNIGFNGITDIIFKNGNYFAIGNTAYPDASFNTVRNVFATKLNGNGIIDLAFDPSGMKKFTSVTAHTAGKILDYDGGLLIIGLSNYKIGTFLKIDENGNLDATYGDNGLKKIVFLNGICTCGYDISDINLIDNDLYYVLHYDDPMSNTRNLKKFDLSTLQATNTVSSLNTTQIANFSNYYPTKYLIDNNKIYILQCITSCTSPGFYITRRNLNGTLDTTFNQTGSYNFNFPGQASITTVNQSATTLFKHSDGKVFIGGYISRTGYTTAPNTGFAMLRIADETTLSQSGIEDNHFILSPNPVQDILTISNPDNIIIDKVVISDVLGKITMTSPGSISSIHLENLKNGLYFVKIFSAGKTECFKIIKSN